MSETFHIASTTRTTYSQTTTIPSGTNLSSVNHKLGTVKVFWNNIGTSIVTNHLSLSYTLFEVKPFFPRIKFPIFHASKIDVRVLMELWTNSALGFYHHL